MDMQFKSILSSSAAAPMLVSENGFKAEKVNNSQIYEGNKKMNLDEVEESKSLRSDRDYCSYPISSSISDEKLRRFFAEDKIPTNFASPLKKRSRLPTIYEHSVCTPSASEEANRPLRGLRFPRTESLPQNKFTESLRLCSLKKEEKENNSTKVDENEKNNNDNDDMRSVSSSTISSTSTDDSQKSLSLIFKVCEVDNNTYSIESSTLNNNNKKSERNQRTMERKRPTKLEIDEKLRKLNASFPSPCSDCSVSLSPASRTSPLSDALLEPRIFNFSHGFR